MRDVECAEVLLKQAASRKSRSQIVRNWTCRAKRLRDVISYHLQQDSCEMVGVTLCLLFVSEQGQILTRVGAGPRQSVVGL
jgi:hypothetical protein